MDSSYFSWVVSHESRGLSKSISWEVKNKFRWLKKISQVTQHRRHPLALMELNPVQPLGIQGLQLRTELDLFQYPKNVINWVGL